MAIIGSNSKYRRMDALLKVPTHAHPQYHAYKDIWKEQRDAIEGEDAVKEETTLYLPQMQGSDNLDYVDFLARAVFVNMTGRTKNGLVGSIFRRKPAIEGIPEKYLSDLEESFTDDGNSVTQACKMVADEIVSVGRMGGLVDLAEDGSGLPYVSLYKAENILDWDVERIKGRQVVTRVVLREGRQIREPGALFFAHKVVTRYRVLFLDYGPNGPVYKQAIYENPSEDADLTDLNPVIAIPMNRGRTFDFIPFEFFGPFEGTPAVEKSPIRDIVVLNFAHYRDYAQLQHGRYFTAMPIFYAPTASDGNEYVLGPNVVWEIGADDEKPGLLEFHGHGLTFLEHALSDKENQIAALGGRLLAAAATGSESDNAVKMKEANESSMLLNIVSNVNRSMSRLLRTWIMWAEGAAKPDMKINVSLNTDFLLTETGAREFRAIQSMYLDGVIPIEVVYDYLLKSEVIPESMELKAFKLLLDDTESFPNQPDALARKAGYPNAAAQLKEEEDQAQRDADAETARIAAEATAKAAEAAAKIAAAKPKPTGPAV